MAELGLAPMCTSFGAGTRAAPPGRRAAEVGTRDGASPLRPLLVNTVVADTDAEAIAEAQIYMTPYMQAQIDHYGATVDMRREGYEAWAATFERWKLADRPRTCPSGRRG